MADTDTRSVADRMRAMGNMRLFFGPRSVIERMRDELGLGQFYELYRVAAALALADRAHQEPLPSDPSGDKQEVRLDKVDQSDDDFVFYRLFCRLAGAQVDPEDYRTNLKATIDEGLQYMYYVLGVGRGEYREKDYRLIVRVLSEVEAGDFSSGRQDTAPADEVLVRLGTVKGEPKTIALNNRHLVPALNMAITGTSGSGKTYFAVNLISQVLENSPITRCVILDPKGDIAEKYGERLLQHEFDFYRLSLDTPTDRNVRQSLPLNPFEIGQGRNAVALRLLAVFREAVFHNNPVQEATFRTAVNDLLTMEEPSSLTVEDLAQAYRVVKGDRPDTVSNFLETLVNNRVFSSPGMTPREFFQRNVVISYAPDLDPMVQGLVTNLLVTLFRDAHQDLSEGPTTSDFRRLNRLLFLDEAHNLTDMKSSGLKRLLREGRSFGLGLMMASQHVNHFGQLVKGVDLREEVPLWFVLKQTINAKTQRLLASMFGMTSTADQKHLENLVGRLTGAADGEYAAITNVDDLHLQGELLQLNDQS